MPSPDTDPQADRPFHTSYTAFAEELPDLLRSHPGQWVAYHGSNRIVIGGSQTQVLHECYRQGYSDDEIMVVRVEPEPPLAHTEW